jgi:hypothetical protein
MKSDPGGGIPAAREKLFGGGRPIRKVEAKSGTKQARRDDSPTLQNEFRVRPQKKSAHLYHPLGRRKSATDA